MASAAFFLALAAVDFMEPSAECEIKGPLWANWLCLGAGFAGAGLARRPARGAATGVGLIAIPAVIVALVSGLWGGLFR